MADRGPENDARETPPIARRRRRAVWAGLALLVSIGLDLGRAPDRQWSAKVLLGTIDLYQATLSPHMPSLGVHCRFTLTCSHYAEESIRRHGALWGSLRAAWRILRCGPWTPPGTHDPP